MIKSEANVIVATAHRSDAGSPSVAVYFLAGIILTALCALAWVANGCYSFGIDDANIFFSYAENLSSGNGITYGSNGVRVEGFTSLLWMLMCSGMFLVQLREFGVLGLCLILLLGSIAVGMGAVYENSKKTGIRGATPVSLFFVLIASSPGFVTWMSITLMDVSLWTFTVASMAFFVVDPPQTRRGRWTLIVLLALAPLVRPEAFVVCPAFIMLIGLRLAALQMLDYKKWVIVFTCVVLGSLALLTLFRIAYFGYPLPNTYYAKVSPSIFYNITEGIKYLGKFVLDGPINCILVCFCVAYAVGTAASFLIRVRSSNLTPAFQASGLLSAAGCLSWAAVALLAAPVLNGGDHFGMFRFFQPAYFLMCLTAALVLQENLVSTGLVGRALGKQFQPKNLPRTAFALGCMVALVLNGFRDSWIRVVALGSPIKHEFENARVGLLQGRHLNSLFAGMDKYPSVGVIIVGGFGRSYQGVVVDLMGLNSLEFAHYPGERKGIKNHSAFEKGAFYMLAPDIVLFNPNSWGSKVLKDVDHDDEFKKQWCYGTIFRKGDSGAGIRVFVKQSWLNQAVKTGVIRFEGSINS